MALLSVMAPALEAAIAGQQAVLASSVLPRVRMKDPASLLLAAIFLSSCLMMVVNLVTHGAGPLAEVNLPLELLLPAEVFLYVRHVGRTRPVRPGALLHTLPALVGTVVWSARLAPSMDPLTIACWWAYLLAAGVVLRRRAPSLAPPVLGFATVLVGAFGATAILRLAVTVDLSRVASFRDGLPYVLLLVVVLAMTSILLLLALRDPEVLHLPSAPVAVVACKSPQTPAPLPAATDDLHARLAALLEAGKPYLDPDLSVAQLSAKLEAPPRQVSHVINATYGTNFAALMNHQRVLFAARALRDAALADRPIKAIMYDAGFRSKSAFNREFRRYFATSPTDYRKSATCPSASRRTGL